MPAELITAAEVISKTAQFSNTETVLIKSEHIVGAQLAYLRPILGDDFYDAIIAGTFDADTDLLAHIKNCLAYWVAYTVAPFMFAQFGSKGFMVNQDDESRPVSSAELKLAKEGFLDMGLTYKNELVRFIEDELDDDPTKYPDYLNEVGDTQKSGGIII